MNLLTFDIEEWFLVQTYFNANKAKCAEYDRLLEELLENLEYNELKATFFCVGKMATLFPSVIRKIDSAGHEVGCHSNTHQWLNKMSFDEAMEDTHSGVDALQQCIGKKVKSYRAPAFSIGGDNKWAFEVLAANGITCDASVFPASRDLGGFAGFKYCEPTIINYKGIELHEYPIVTTSVWGKEIAYSGGGYFRFFPYRFVKNKMEQSSYSMTYFHLSDFLPVYTGLMTKDVYENYFHKPGTMKARYMRYLKNNLGTSDCKKKLFRLLNNMSFSNIVEVESKYKWENAPVLSLLP